MLQERILEEGDVAPFAGFNLGGRSPFLLVADHAGRAIPRQLKDLGLPPTEMARHIAWDIGIADVAQRLSVLLDAPYVEQRYSRLVIDCNRAPDHPTSIPEESDGTLVTANRGLSKAHVQKRQQEIFYPYHHFIEKVINRRLVQNYPPVLVALHSFTPCMSGFQRPWHIGVLYNRETRLALALRDLLQEELGDVVGDNEPYAMTDTSDYTVPFHAERRGLCCVEIEIRQDLLSAAGGAEYWAKLLERLLPEAVKRMGA